MRQERPRLEPRRWPHEGDGKSQRLLQGETAKTRQLEIALLCIAQNLVELY